MHQIASNILGSVEVCSAKHDAQMGILRRLTRNQLEAVCLESPPPPRLQSPTISIINLNIAWIYRRICYEMLSVLLLLWVVAFLNPKAAMLALCLSPMWVFSVYKFVKCSHPFCLLEEAGFTLIQMDSMSYAFGFVPPSLSPSMKPEDVPGVALSIVHSTRGAVPGCKEE